MQDLPYLYRASSEARPEGPVALASEGLEPILSEPPVEFGGAGDRWSPEQLLVAAVADCFCLTFRAIAKASRLSWSELSCEVEGRLDRSGRLTCFTEISLRPCLRIDDGGDPERARRLLAKAEEGCLITNSLSATVRLEAVEVSVGTKPAT